MEGLYRCCCGIDVHAKRLVGCPLREGKKKEVANEAQTLCGHQSIPVREASC